MTLVAVADDKVVGSLTLNRYGEAKKASHVRVLGMLVVSEFRGKGIGSILIKAAIDWARTQHIRKIILSVFSSNPQAVTLYKKFGFEIEGVGRAQYSVNRQYVDEVVMGLHLVG